MEVQELRVGNHIIDCYNVINTVASIHKGGSVRFEDGTICRIDKCKPIELTEQLLLKSGFTKSWSDFYYNGLFGVSSDFDALCFKTCILANGIIRNLHQLQNLYYALTGTELEINL